MVRRCAWCGRTLGRVGGGNGTTDTICSQCQARVLEPHEKRLLKWKRERRSRIGNTEVIQR